MADADIKAKMQRSLDAARAVVPPEAPIILIDAEQIDEAAKQPGTPESLAQAGITITSIKPAPFRTRSAAEFLGVQD